MAILICKDRGLVHDEHGIWVTGFSGQISITTNMHVELVVNCQGLLTSLELGAGSFKLETDSLEAVNLIKIEDNSTHEYGIIIKDIRHIFLMKPTIK